MHGEKSSPMMGLRYHHSVIMADLFMHDTLGHTLWCAIEFKYFAFHHVIIKLYNNYVTESMYSCYNS